MTLGTSLFSTMSVRAFSRLNADISQLQTDISSGKNDPRASADPVRAMRLSVAQEQTASLDRFSSNLTRVGSRLDQSDATLAELNSIMHRFTEIALRGASASTVPAERETLRIEAAELRSAMIDLANGRDAMGRTLFGGFGTETAPFVDTPEGVQYAGDRGQHMLRVSESMTMPTGLDGGAVFMGVEGADGRRPVFDIIDDLMFSLRSDATSRRAEQTATGGLAVRPQPTRDPETWSMTVTGPSGSAVVAAELAEGIPDPLLDAINAQSAATGVTAALHGDGQTLILSPVTGPADAVSVSDLHTEPDRRAVLAQGWSLDGAGLPAGTATDLIPQRLATTAQIDSIGAASSHFADQRAQVGALGDVAARQAAAIENRQVLLQQAVAGLEDLDIAKAVTELQSLLLTRDAAQQSFARISQNSLFDYLR
ncbi:flagellar hook-associated protein FlgL [Meridianimarinicoccus sp. RP-17]|uniref:flagellar hook-associated protein FlgL n=1 Tax=Meridianimarinicoccus zhengii TaxID=2056810 RepID=UPI000DAC92C0|nr:flagellar hook-associated protein FlgL [Phycocomes zhengii]